MRGGKAPSLKSLPPLVQERGIKGVRLIDISYGIVDGEGAKKVNC